MSVATHISACGQHPEIVSVGVCTRCSQPMCEGCAVEVIATEQVFCSERCRAATLSGESARTNLELREGLKAPVRTGWTLCARSLGVLTIQLLPYAIAANLFFFVLGRVGGDSGETGSTTEPWLAFLLMSLFVLGGAFGVALVGVILSGRQTGLTQGSPYLWTLRRFVPWLVTWALTIAIVTAGYVALIIPGIFLSLRLFWADEFALLHGKGPIASLKASWALTEGIELSIMKFQFLMGWASYLVIIPAFVLIAVVTGGVAALGLDQAMGLALVGLSMVLIGYIAYGALHAPEIVKFYGLRAARSSLDAGELATKGWLERERRR